MAAKDKVPDEVPVFNIHDGLVGRNGGPYLDEELAKRAEELNARREGRKPNFSESHLRSVTHPGQVLVTAEQLARVSADATSVAQENKAPEYGKIPNPVKQDQEAQAEAAKVAQARAENASAQAEADKQEREEAIKNAGKQDKSNDDQNKGNQTSGSKTDPDLGV